MAESKKPVVIGDVHFVWVDDYEGSALKEHWLSISHSSIVRIFESKYQENEGSVFLYKPGTFPTKNSGNCYIKCHENLYLDTVWQIAADWAKSPPGN